MANTEFYEFFKGPVFLSCIFSWMCAQFVKTIIKLFTGKVKNLRELFELLFWRTGSMPSSHSATVGSLCTTVGFSSGFSSDIFCVSLVFLFITIRDALGVRRASGIQARVLNEVGKDLVAKEIIEFKPIKEVQGHTPLEVFVGLLLGIFVGVAFSVL